MEVEEYIPEVKNTEYKVYIKNNRLTINKMDGYSEEEIKWAKEIDIQVEGILEENELIVIPGQKDIKVIVEKGYIVDLEKYMYKLTKLEDGVATEWLEKQENTHIFENLEPGKEYRIDVKIITKSGEESQTISKVVTTMNKVIINGVPEEWTNQSASITLLYGTIPNGYKMQYKFSVGAWIDYVGAITLNENQIVSARLYNEVLNEEIGTNTVDIVKIDKIPPTVPTTFETKGETNQVIVKANGSVDTLSGMAGYKYSMDNINWTQLIKAEEEYIFSGIKAGSDLIIYVKAVDKINNESQIISKSTSTTQITDKVTINGIPINWTNQNASITLAYANIPSGYKVQYKLGTGAWTNYTSTITVTQNQLVSARLYNQVLDDEVGTNSEDIIKIDKVVPNSAIIDLPSTSNVVNFTATITQSDSLSGVNASQSKYKLSTSAGVFGITSAEWNSEANTFSSNNQTINLTASNGTYYLHVLTVDNVGNKIETVSSNGIVVNMVTTSIAPPGGILYEDSKGNSAPIPNGFVVSSIGAERNIDDGLVIKQGSNGSSTTSNEFVWIPLMDINEMYDEATKRGKLYQFGTNRVSTLISGCLTNTTGNREPDIVRNYDGNSSYDSIGITKALLQKEFDSMIASVKKYNGFYIGRYETGNLSKPVVVVQKGNNDISNQTWYTMYSKSKAMISNSYVQTGIIWGSQWDTTLRYMNKYESIGDYVSNSFGKGNFSGKIMVTGSNEQYKVKNIFDMAGNIADRTMEPVDSAGRCMRGNSYDYSQGSAGVRSGVYYPIYSYVSVGVRMQLYLL